MAIGLKAPASLLPVDGVRIAVGCTGLRAGNDLTLITLDTPNRVAAVFTQNAFRAPPVQIAEQHLQTNVTAKTARALLINAGNANAGTGQAGHDDALELCRLTGQALGIKPAAVLPFSTGVIGERLAVQRIATELKAMPHRLSVDWLPAASAIMTTDTVAKGISRTFSFQGRNHVVTGIAKGAGMIRPDMATLLAFMATDAPVPLEQLKDLLHKVVASSLNRITVDGDTSTNDACVLISTGTLQSKPGASDWQALADAVQEVALYLAHAIVRDAEGATRFLSVAVEGGRNEAECLQVAYAIAHSPLVKTAVFAGDPNWGRLLMAIGHAGIALDPNQVSVLLDDVCLFRQGNLAREYNEAAAVKVMAQEEFSVRVLLGQGKASAVVWTSDLSYDYIRINAEYRT